MLLSILIFSLNRLMSLINYVTKLKFDRCVTSIKFVDLL